MRISVNDDGHSAAEALEGTPVVAVPQRVLSCLIVFQVVLTASVEAQHALGTDVSHYQGSSLDWSSIKSSGVTFAWAKATEGTTYTDASFTANAVNAPAAGVPIGAYHYAHPETHIGTAGADAEAQAFWNVAKNYVKGGGSYLMPMLDIEQSLSGASPAYTKTTLSQWVNQWCNDVAYYASTSGVVVKPVVYTYMSYSSAWLDSTVTQWPLWMASYPSCTSNAACQCVECGSSVPLTGAPSSTAPWSTWDIWQYGDTNWSGGDSDVYNGSFSQFIAKFVIGNQGLTNQSAALGASATFVAHVNGTALRFQWLFDSNVIAGVTASNCVIANAQLTNAGLYTVNVSNAASLIYSSSAYLSVIAPLSNAPGGALAPQGLAQWWTADGNTQDIYSGSWATPVGGFVYAPGEVGLAFHFDGASSYLQLTNPTATLAPPWTACFWVNRQNTPRTSATLLGDATYLLKLEQYNASRAVGFTKIGTSDYVFSPSYVAPVGVWTHLAFVANGTATTLYVNGAQQGSVNTVIPLGRLFMGGDTYGDYMAGSIDEAMVFSRALAPAEIQSICSAGASGLVRAAQFVTATTYPNGNFGLIFEGLTGKKVNISSTSDFVNWGAPIVIANSSGTNQYIDTGASGAAYRFYRIR